MKIVWVSAVGILTLFFFLAFLAPAVCPNPPERQFRESFYMPPTPVRLFDDEGRFHFRPFVYVYKRISDLPNYEATDQKVFLTLFAEGESYQFLGLTFNTRLVGVQNGRQALFLLGTDSLGRDVFSRLIHGARFSLAVGVVGILLTLLLGVSLGVLSGYVSGWVDRVIMRVCDLFLSLPGLFLVLGLRAVFPLDLSGQRMFWLIVLIFSLIGWGSVTRVIRGQVLSVRNRPHVLAARSIGASHSRIIIWHILPFTLNYLMVQASVFFPLFILGEITLSFLGVGVQEPGVSLGSLLNSAASLPALSQYQWLVSPVVAIFLMVFCFNLIADELKVKGRVRFNWW